MSSKQDELTALQNTKIQNKEILDIAFFGKGLSVILFVFFALSYYKGHERWWLLCLSILLMLLAFIMPQVIKPIYKLALKFGSFMHHIISPVLMAITFYVVFMPVGILFRLIRKDLLKLKIKQPETYWIKRNPPGPERNSLKNQF